MWCAPRTVSTALLRSFVQRADCEGIDEPLYAHYLAVTGKQHPMQAEILASQSQDPRELLQDVLLGPTAAPLQFVKHMAHHLVGGFDPRTGAQACAYLDAPGVVHAFLVREPRAMLASLHRALGPLERFDTALGQQVAMFRHLQATRGEDPLVIDSREVLQEPAGMLRALCERIGLEFDPAMLAWEPGRHPSFGVWAPHWYANVEKSSGFEARAEKAVPLPEELEPLLDWAAPLYAELAAARLKPAAA